MNWVDVIIICVLLASTAAGFTEGLTRMVIGSAALVFGFIAASWFYGIPANWLRSVVPNDALANIFGFLLVLVGIILLGAFVAWVVQRIFKVVGLSWLDRLAGGAFGAFRAVLLLAVLALLITTFAPRRMPRAASQSQLAPYILSLSKVLSAITPYQIKNRFEQTYQEWRAVVEGMKDPTEKSRRRGSLKYE